MERAKHYHQSNLRKYRKSIPGNYYAITVCTANREPLLINDALAQLVLRLLVDPILLNDSECLCCVVMPDHWHALIKLGDSELLYKLMQRIKTITAKESNSFLGRSGQALWQKGYYERRLGNHQEISDACAYILHNPVRAGIVDSVADYAHWHCIYEIDEVSLKWK